MHVLWWLFWLILVVLFIWFVVSMSRKSEAKRPETPLEMLQRRDAAGEITTDEYEERKARLGRDTVNMPDAPSDSEGPPRCLSYLRDDA